MNNAVKAVFFDLGNVIIDFDHLIAVDKIRDFTPKSREEVFQLIFDSKLTELFEEGKISEVEFFVGLSKTLDLELPYQSFVPIWNEIFFVTSKNRFVQSVAARLKGKVPVFLISNVNVLHFRYIETTFQIAGLFDRLILSYEVGARKPDPLIYHEAIAHAGCAPGDIVYFDDRADLIEAAKGLGLRGMQFTDIRSFKEQLRSSDLQYDTSEGLHEDG